MKHCNQVRIGDVVHALLSTVTITDSGEDKVALDFDWFSFKTDHPYTDAQTFCKIITKEIVFEMFSIISAIQRQLLGKLILHWCGNSWNLFEPVQFGKAKLNGCFHFLQKASTDVKEIF